mmetsp:Transcript_6205/g.19193  ORF Transcript_6205/g.19193 Transcript_6205/m.19193 type:complete len:97 (-) Transcript_6205:868-1158(-)|eukprot:349754-Chlamydomonas_euryale.AAC.4
MPEDVQHETLDLEEAIVGSKWSLRPHTQTPRPHSPAPQGWVIEGDDCPGELLSFMRADERHWRSVHAIPRITSKGCVTGAVYRVSSKPDMEHLARA